ncbi:MAG: hypothetical protein QM752_06000 [Gammaproteobacteria bacterium]
MIFFIRFVTATCLFAFLGKANIWLTPLSNTLLAIGYRFFLITSPLFSRLFGKYAITIALIISTIGTLLFCLNGNYQMTIGSILVGIGFSVSGYLIKSEAAETTTGAAHNKIALNAGSLASGIVLLLSINSKDVFFFISACVLFFIILFSIKNSIKKDIVLSIPKSFDKKRWFGWLFVGIAIGIKFFGVLSVLPQYILSTKHNLPNWYGIMIFINSGTVILLQIPIIRLLDRFHPNNSVKITFYLMLIGMILIAFPQYFHAYTMIGAALWTIILSIIECFASYLDAYGSKAGFLLVKETAVGIGAGLAVFFGRYFTSDVSSLLISGCGILSIILASILLNSDLLIKNFLNYSQEKNYLA